jgi:hypothetical protein
MEGGQQGQTRGQHTQDNSILEQFILGEIVSVIAEKSAAFLVLRQQRSDFLKISLTILKENNTSFHKISKRCKTLYSSERKSDDPFERAKQASHNKCFSKRSNEYVRI